MTHRKLEIPSRKLPENELIEEQNQLQSGDANDQNSEGMVTQTVQRNSINLGKEIRALQNQGVESPQAALLTIQLEELIKELDREKQKRSSLEVEVIYVPTKT